MEELLRDLKHAGRTLARTPGLTAVAVLSLALGIGANTAIFSVVNAVLFESLPYDEPHRLVRLWETFSHPGGQGTGSVSVPNYDDWRAEDVFEGLGAYISTSYNLTGGDLPVRVAGSAVTAEVFPLLGVDPALGRTLSADEDEAGNDRVVVLSHGLWQSRFNGSRDAVGQELGLNGETYTVIGVMPPEFRFPPDSEALLWKPLVFSESRRTARERHWMSVLGRLRPGVEVSAAQAAMTTVGRRLAELFPDAQEGRGVLVRRLSESVVGDVRPLLLTLWGAVGFVLLIGCGNVANLLLARSAARSRELALRTALGAPRGRLMRLLLAESLLLSIAGGVLGLALGRWAIGYLVSLPGAAIPRGSEVGIDLRVLLFSVGVALFAAAAAGIVPALRASKINLQEAIKEGGKGKSVGGRSDRLRSGLVVAEVALAQVVLIGASLMLRSFLMLQGVDPGVRADGVLTMRVPLPAARYSETSAITGFYERLLEEVGAIPGVDAAGAINVLPIQDWGTNGEFLIDGRPPASSGEQPFAELRVVSPGYFEAMGIPVESGRAFTAGDRDGSPRVVMVNSTLAKRYWPDGDPLGARLTLDDPSAEDAWMTVVGVAGDVKGAGLDQETRAELYMPIAQLAVPQLSLAIHAGVDPASLVTTIRSEVAKLDPELPVDKVSTMEEVIAEFLAEWRFNAALLIFFAVLALVLALAGVYGVMSYNVTQRTSELGLRMALGAQRGDVLKLVARQGLVLAAIGAVIGLGAALALTRFLSSRLYAIDATDPLTFAVATLFLVAVTLAACFVPARRASRTDPMVALRHE